MREISLALRFQECIHSDLFDEAKINQNLIKVLSYMAPEFLKSVEFDLLLVDDVEMSKINSDRRGLKKTTDVLSFPLYQEFPPLPHQMIGEVIISVDTLREQSESIGHSDIEEFYRLLVHGVLHLFGYDHETSEEDASIMRNFEDECLDLIFNSGHGS